MENEELTVSEETAVEAEPEAETEVAESAASPAATGASLVVMRNGAETEYTFPVNPPSIIGRFDPSVGPIDVDLGGIPEGSYVSRKHAKITQGEDGYVLTDLGSSNGTFLLRDDWERIEEAPIADGQQIAFGNARFVFKVVESTPAE